MCFLNNILQLELIEIIATIPKSPTTVNENGSKKKLFLGQALTSSGEHLKQIQRSKNQVCKY